ncbi:hypothetical protein N0M98_02080 [Paenibacillus doosanensis]|uniref:hypothetical protein n=1 Tax=Paenibacillus doosanensis TaxID=1229154 RepID=UPI00217F2C52|nr:hypothetical protein [Paenibacillus doosanensis]MCS7458917.1 hypothetical protein [Paenibacillus doosanensis]
MEIEEKREWALRYVQGLLGEQEKRTVFELILTDAEFKRCLKEEVELFAKLRQLRSSLQPDRKRELLAAIKRQAAADRSDAANEAQEEARPWIWWSELTLQLTLPPVIYPMMKFLQRRCLT